MKQHPIIIVTIITLLLLTSCSTPAVAPTPTPTVTIEPTPVVTVTPVPTATPLPTATPRIEPYSPEEAEQLLEAITGTDVTHQKDHDLKGRYGFKDDSYTYLIDRNNGKLAILVNHSSSTSSESVDIEEAKQIAIDAVKKYDPSLFELNVKCDAKECGSEYSVTLLQVSQKFGRNTGNRADARVTANGDIGSILIHNNEDPTIADQDYAIPEEEALEIAYDICIEGIKKQMVNSPDATAELEDRQKHTVEINFSIHKGEPKWSISIIVPSNIGYTLGYAIIINANTGEIIHVGGYL